MVDYIPYDPLNPYVKELETEIRRLFADEEDAYIKTMCYLASSLDGRKRRPLFYIWLGEGQNGKSFLLEMHISTLREVMKGGYGAKINMDFFTQDRKNKGGPDSEKMMLKFARYAYCSESERGDTLKMAKIKEFTSETLSGNDKHKTQDMFRADCHFTAATNNDPKIIGNDHGTWRRIWAYRFKMMFVGNPNPNNKYEYKENFKFSEIVTKDPNYKRAYLSILVKFYELYRDKYNCDLTLINSPSMDRDTIEYRCEQDTITRFIKEQIRHVGKTSNKKDVTTGEFEKIADVPITDLTAKYIEWYKAKIGSNTEDLVPKEIIRDLVKTKELKNFIEKRKTDFYLKEHLVLNLGEEYEEPVFQKPAQAVESSIIDDEFLDEIDEPIISKDNKNKDEIVEDNIQNDKIEDEFLDEDNDEYLE
jgi:phage/plasmid-associated DNA primase